MSSDSDICNISTFTTDSTGPLRKSIIFEVMKICPVWQTGKLQKIYRAIVSDNSGSLLLVAFDTVGKEVNLNLKEGRTFQLLPGFGDVIRKTDDLVWMAPNSFGFEIYLKIENSQGLRSHPVKIEGPKFHIPFKFMRLVDAIDSGINSFVDTIGIIESVTPGSASLTFKTPQVVRLKSVTDTPVGGTHFMDVVLWNPMSKEVKKSMIGKVLAIKDGRVDSYNGKKQLMVSIARSLLQLINRDEVSNWLTDDEENHYGVRIKLSIKKRPSSEMGISSHVLDENFTPPMASTSNSRFVVNNVGNEFDRPSSSISISSDENHRNSNNANSNGNGTPTTPKRRKPIVETLGKVAEMLNRKRKSFEVTVSNVRIGDVEIHRYFACPSCFQNVTDIKDLATFDCGLKKCTREKTSSVQKYSLMLRNVKLVEDGCAGTLEGFVCYPKNSKSIATNCWAYEDAQTIQNIKTLFFARMTLKFEKNRDKSWKRTIDAIDISPDPN